MGQHPLPGFWDLVLAIGTSLFIIAVVFLLFKEIQAILYDREIALSVGLPERWIYYLIVFVLGITVAVSMRLIGALLVDALVLLPAIAAHMISRSLKQMFLLSSLFGLIFRAWRSFRLPCGGYPRKLCDHPLCFGNHRLLHALPKEVYPPCENSSRSVGLSLP